jgi:hypothetical protein
MRIGGEPVGPNGLALLGVTAVAGILLAAHGWSGRSAGLAPGSLAGSGGSARPAASAPAASPPAHQSAGPTAPARHAAASAAASPGSAAPGPAAPGPAASPGASSSATPGPLLSSQSFASYAFQVWPGPRSAAAKSALIGLSVSVHRTGSGLSVVAGVAGQPNPAPHFYPGGARVYVVEASLGDDSGNSDYNLGDDGLVVTDSKGRIIQ